MAEISGRESLEAELTRKLSRGLRTQYKLLTSKLGDPPRLENLTAEELKEFDQILTRLLGSTTQELFVDQAETMVEATPGLSGVDWSQINELAAAWSQKYTFDLVRGINENSLKVLRSSISNYYAQGWTRKELETALAREFGARRAATIAVTEVTRACVEGERAVAEAVMADGFAMKPIWQTNNDGLVCPQCGPRHDKEITDNVFPPVHPNCRCWVNWILADSKAVREILKKEKEQKLDAMLDDLVEVLGG